MAGSISLMNVASCVVFIICIFNAFSPPVVGANYEVVGNRREAIEIIIGGGGASPPPENEGCPPPPPPPPPEPPCPPPPRPPRPPPPPSGFESVLIQNAYFAIRKLRAKIKSDPHNITATWTGKNVCRDYRGFICDTRPDMNLKAVAGVKFNGFNFGGDDLTVTEFLSNMPDLAFFHANSNNFTGAIPSVIGNFKYFYELDLSNNKFTGAFPYQVLAATKLTFLDLRFNSYSGFLPPQVFTLDLDILFVNNNNFFQPLPDNLGQTPVRYLTLANNKFTGPIPKSIGQASKTLIEVLFLNNQLYGCLPLEIGYLNQATVFDVGFNQLTGSIPHSFGCLEKMEFLNLAGNSLYGPVPEIVCTLPNLANFTASYNYFTQVGPECMKLIKLNILDVKMNCILGLPNQRSPYECASFFSQPKICPDLTYVPCGKQDLSDTLQSSNRISMAPAPQPRSYSVLSPH